MITFRVEIRDAYSSTPIEIIPNISTLDDAIKLATKALDSWKSDGYRSEYIPNPDNSAIVGRVYITDDFEDLDIFALILNTIVL